jgi:hypothetical protein
MSYNPVVYFISTDYLKQNTPIESNVDDHKLVPFITQAEQTYLQQSIGETGLNALKDGVVNNTLTPDEQTFIRNFVQPLVAQYTFYLALPFIAYKSTNKSLSKEASEYSQPVDLTELQYIRNNVKDVAEFYQRRMVKWLLDYPGTFWWFDNPNSRDNLPKSPQAYFSGMYTPFGYGWPGIRTWVEPYGATQPCNGCGGWGTSNLYW